MIIYDNKLVVLNHSFQNSCRLQQNIAVMASFCVELPHDYN